jgi:DNA polymerase IV (DinB-like DNA polymerase)
MAIAKRSEREVMRLPERIVMLVDLDYFFAQCEELRNPTLRGKPVVIGMYSGRTEESGAVSTANYAARKYGVKSGIPLFLAKKRLEDVESVFLPVDYDYYEQVSGRLMLIFRSYADSFEQVGIDEAYLEVTKKLDWKFECTKGLVGAMKEEVKRREGFTFSVGVGPNKLVAKVAADVVKPDGLTVVCPSDVKQFLSPLPVDRLIGVGKKTAIKMAAMNIKTVGELACYDVQRLVEVFGKTLGVYFHNAANGIDNEPVREAGEVESISRISTLKENTRDLEIILERTDHQTEEIVKEVFAKNLRFKQVGIIAIMTDLSMKSRSQTLDKPASDLESIKKTVRDLFGKYLDESDLEIRRVGVRVSGFVKEEVNQKQLTSFFQT